MRNDRRLLIDEGTKAEQNNENNSSEEEGKIINCAKDYYKILNFINSLFPNIKTQSN